MRPEYKRRPTFKLLPPDEPNPIENDMFQLAPPDSQRQLDQSQEQLIKSASPISNSLDRHSDAPSEQEEAIIS